MDRLLEYAGNHPWLAAAAVIMILIVLAYELRARSSSFAAVSPQELIRMMNHGALVLDIRSKDQYAEGHIAGARQMPSDQILTAGEKMKKHKDKPIVVYCDTGSLGASAARRLAAQGFTKAFNLRGGLAAWRAENLPLARG